MDKNIYLDIIGKKHSLNDTLLNHPPNGYQVIYKDNWQDDLTQKFCKFDMLYDFQKKILSKFIPINLYKSYLEKNKRIPDNTVLTFSSGHPIFRKERWIVDLEFVTHLCGYNRGHFNRHKRTIEKLLDSDYCKKIMPWTNAGATTILNTFDSKKIQNKVETVYLAVPQKTFTKTYNKDKLSLYFVGSQNIPKDFDIKGGKEVLRSFEILNKIYKNLELNIRSYVPESLKRKYSRLENVHIYNEILPWDHLENLFKNSDIFLFPSHNTPGLIFLDAMSYELPIITTDVWANSEMVGDGVNGFLVQKSNSIKYFNENLIPMWSEQNSLNLIKNHVDLKVINDIVEKTATLIEDVNLRKKMGKNGRKMIDTGKFSLKIRNNKLKKIFDDALKTI